MEKQRVQTPDESTPYAIEMLHITKRFPGIIANAVSYTHLTLPTTPYV